MEREELFALRDGEKCFDKVPQMNEFLKDLFGQDFTLPVVVGYKDFPKSEWEIKGVPPLTNVSELTIRNYLEGLKQIGEDKTFGDTFRGAISFYGVNSFHYENLDSLLLSAVVYGEGNHNLSPKFTLSLYFSDRNDSSIGANGYEAVSKLVKTPLQKLCERFVGPNTQYERRLI